MTDQSRRLVRGSKKLSWLLRFGANETGLEMDAAGWVQRDEVLRAARLDAAELDEIVRHNNKQRFEVDGSRVRACQGHGMDGTPVTREALEASWAVYGGDDAIWHGTNLQAVAGIAEGGILAVDRSHVHLAETTSSRVGKKANVAVMLQVSAARLRQLGREVFVSPNGVVLTRDVPPSAIVDLLAQTDKAKMAEATLRELLGLADSGFGMRDNGQ